MNNVIGIKNIRAKKDGTEFVELHTTFDDRFIEGTGVETVFVRKDMIDNVELLEIGCGVQIYYNRFGRVDRVAVVSV